TVDANCRLWAREKVHFIVGSADLVRNARFPCLDFVHLLHFLVVSAFAHVYLHVSTAFWSTSRISGDKHDEALLNDFVNMVIPVLTRLEDLIFEEPPIYRMDSLFWSIKPAHIQPLFAIFRLPCPMNLAYNRLCGVVW